MKKIVLFFIFSLIGQILYSQSWQTIYPNTGSEDVKDVAVLDNGILLLAKDGGKIIQSTNNGDNWQTIHSNPVYSIQKMICVSNTIWYFFCSDGKFLKTTNGGNSFVYLNNVYSTTVNFLNENLGYVYYNTDKAIRKTTNGGESWIQVHTFNENFILNQFCFINQNTGYISGQRFYPSTKSMSSRFLRTTNGGISWDTLYYNLINYYTPTNMQFFGNTGFINSYEYYYKTTDGGLSWDIRRPQPSAYDIKMCFQNDQKGAIIGYNESNFSVYVTSNGGQNWQVKNLSNISIHSSNNFIASKNEKIIIGQEKGFYHLSVDNGQNWEGNRFNARISKIKFVNETTGYLLTGRPNYSIYKTTNQGGKWFKPDNFLDGNGIKDFYFFGDNHIQIIKYDTVMNSYDGGQSWIQGHYLGSGACPNPNAYHSLKYFNDISGYTFSVTGCPYPGGGVFGSIRKTSNSGNSFNNIQFQNIQQIQFFNESKIFAKSTNSNTPHIYRTTDGCNTWEQISPQLSPNSLKFFMFNDGECWMVSNNSLTRSTNYTDWFTINGFENEVSNFYVKNQNEIFVPKKINNELKIFKTTDRGFTWRSENIPDNFKYGWFTFYETSYYYEQNAGIEFVNDNTGFLYGEEMILKTTNGGITTSINNAIFSIPDNFSLHQNYPNPFNPSTTISYSLKENSDVTLKVFDVTGKLVATLVNEKQSAGGYNFRFSTTDFQLTSGVYFYQLRANDFVQTKKMVLIK